MAVSAVPPDRDVSLSPTKSRFAMNLPASCFTRVLRRGSWMGVAVRSHAFAEGGGSTAERGLFTVFLSQQPSPAAIGVNPVMTHSSARESARLRHRFAWLSTFTFGGLELLCSAGSALAAQLSRAGVEVNVELEPDAVRGSFAQPATRSTPVASSAIAKRLVRNP